MPKLLEVMGMDLNHSYGKRLFRGKEMVETALVDAGMGTQLLYANGCVAPPGRTSTP